MSTKPLTSLQVATRVVRYVHAIAGGSILIAVLAVVSSVYGLSIFRVQGQSMEPTLANGRVLPVCIVCARLSVPKKNQIVIVQNADNPDLHLVKRVVGLPGDTVLGNQGPVTLDTDQYFVEGDNRDHSTDSRVFGPILRSQIIAFVIGNNPLPDGL